MNKDFVQKLQTIMAVKSEEVLEKIGDSVGKDIDLSMIGVVCGIMGLYVVRLMCSSGEK